MSPKEILLSCFSNRCSHGLNISSQHLRRQVETNARVGEQLQFTIKTHVVAVVFHPQPLDLVDRDGWKRISAGLIEGARHLAVEVDVSSTVARRIRVSDIRRDEPLPTRQQVHITGHQQGLFTNQHADRVAPTLPKLSRSMSTSANCSRRQLFVPARKTCRTRGEQGVPWQKCNQAKMGRVKIGDCHKIFAGRTAQSPTSVDRENRPAVPLFRVVGPTPRPTRRHLGREHTAITPNAPTRPDTAGNHPDPSDYTKERALGRPSMTLDELDREFTSLRDRVRTIRGYL